MIIPMALMAQPELLILDEPTTGLNPNARAAFWATMRAQTEAGRSILFDTHYLQEAADFADRIVIIDRSRLVATSSRSRINSSRFPASITSAGAIRTGRTQPTCWAIRTRIRWRSAICRKARQAAP